MKKILFIINSLKNKAGSERVACTLANELSKNGFSITLATLKNFKEKAYPISSNVNTITFEMSNILETYKEINSHIKQNHYDIAISHNMGRLSILLAFCTWPQKTKLISLEHVSYESNSFLIKLFKKLTYKKYNQIITLTNHDKKNYEKFHSNIKVIRNPNPFSLNKNENKNFKKNIIAVGRLNHQKGFDILIKSWSRIEKEIPDWKLSIVGDGDLKNKLVNLIRKLDIKNIEIHPATDNIKQFYENASIYVMTSRYEGLPMVLIEAQSFGIPIVALDCPHGPAEIIKNEENGFLIPQQNIKLLEEKIIELAKNKNILSRLSEKSKINSKKFSKEIIINQWIETISE